MVGGCTACAGTGCGKSDEKTNNEKHQKRRRDDKKIKIRRTGRGSRACVCVYFYPVVNGTRVHVISRVCRRNLRSFYTKRYCVRDGKECPLFADVIDRCHNACRPDCVVTHDDRRITQNGELRARPENMYTLFYRIRSTWTGRREKNMCLLLFSTTDTSHVRRNGVVE